MASDVAALRSARNDIDRLLSELTRQSDDAGASAEQGDGATEGAGWGGAGAARDSRRVALDMLALRQRAVVASPRWLSVLSGTFASRMQSCRDMNDFVDALSGFLDLIRPRSQSQRIIDATLKELASASAATNANGVATATRTTAVPQRRKPAPGILVPWAWVHAQRGTSTDTDLAQLSAAQVRKDMRREGQFLVDGLDVDSSSEAEAAPKVGTAEEKPGDDVSSLGATPLGEAIRRALASHDDQLDSAACNRVAERLMKCCARTHAGGACLETLQHVLRCRPGLSVIVVDGERQAKDAAPIAITFSVRRWAQGWGLGAEITVESYFKVMAFDLGDGGGEKAQSDGAWCRVKCTYVQGQLLSSLLEASDGEDAEGARGDFKESEDDGFVIVPPMKDGDAGQKHRRKKEETRIGKSPTRLAFINLEFRNLIGIPELESGEDDEYSDEDDEDEDDDVERGENEGESERDSEGAAVNGSEDTDDSDANAKGSDGESSSEDEGAAVAAALRSIQRFAGLPLADIAAASASTSAPSASSAGKPFSLPTSDVSSSASSSSSFSTGRSEMVPSHTGSARLGGFPLSPLFLTGTTTEEEEEDEGSSYADYSAFSVSEYASSTLSGHSSRSSSATQARSETREERRRRRKMAVAKIQRQRRMHARMGIGMDGPGGFGRFGGVRAGEDPAKNVGMSELHAFGRNKFGMLGTGDTTGRLWPRRINLAGVVELTRISHVACSWFHSVALTDVGLLYSWGDGSDGALGHGDNENVGRPRLVEWFTQSNMENVEGDLRRGRKKKVPDKESRSTPILIVDVDCGSDNLGSHTTACSSTGALFCWGVGGAVGNDSHMAANEPQRLGVDSAVAGQRFTHVACGGCFSLAVTRRGALWSWGKWANGRLGHGPLPRLGVSQSGGDAGRSGVAAQRAAANKGRKRTGVGGGRFMHTMYRRQVPRFLLAPQRVARLRGVKVQRASCGEGHALVCDRRGRLWAWGMASNGQLGIGLSGDQVSPIQIVDRWPRMKRTMNSSNASPGSGMAGGVPKTPFITLVACGARHSAAIDAFGRLYTWGGSGGCMLGIPTDLAVDASAQRYTSIRGRCVIAVFSASRSEVCLFFLRR